MFDNKESRDAADRLGEIWDDVTRGDGNVASPGDRDAALAGRLQQMVPPLNDTTRERMRARVLASQRGEAPTMTPTALVDPTGLIAPLPQQPRSIPRPHRADHPIMRIAAMILLALSIAGAWLGIRSFSGSNDPSTPVQGALFATPTSDEEVAFRETVLLHEVAPVGESRQFMAVILRVTLPVGSTWDLGEYSLALDPYPMSFYVESGEMTVNQNGSSTVLGPEGSFNNGVPGTIENKGSDPLTLVVLLLGGATDSGGDQIGPYPEGARVDVLGNVPVSQPLGFTTVVNFSRAFSNMPDSDPISADANETVAFVAVNSGTMNVNVSAGSEVALGEFGAMKEVPYAPSSGGSITLDAGDTITANVGSSIGGSALHEGTDLVSVYLLTILQQSPEQVAANANAGGSSIDWTIPSPANKVGMAISSIALEPGAEWSYDFDGVTQVQVISGSVSVGFDADNLTQVTPGEYVAGSGSGTYTIRNTGTTVATVLRATMSVFTAAPEGDGSNLPEGVTVETLAHEQVPATPGDVTIHFGPQTIEADSTQSTDSELGASLMIVTDGSIAFSAPMDSEVSVILNPDNAESAIAEQANNPDASFTLRAGDVVVVPHGSSYSLTSAAGQSAWMIWYWFQPVESDATPTPAPNTDLSETPTPAPFAMDAAPTPTPSS